MRYLLLGGSGFIGSHLAKSLAKNHEVIVAGHGSSFSMEGVTYIQLDFTKCKDFTEYIKDVDVIIHMVSTITPSDNLSDVNGEIADNVFPTTILLDNAAKLNKEVVFISSGGTVYGENDNPNKETDDTNPICNYGISKLLIEKYLKLYSHFYGMKYKIIRLSNPYSEKVYHGKKQGVIPIIIDNILNNNPIAVWGENQIRDYIYIDDAINGIISILNYQGSLHTFNIGSGEGHALNDVIKLAETKLNKNARLEEYPPRKCDVKTNILDITRVKQETGWAPSVSLSKGIDIIVEQKRSNQNE